jgi:DNA primase
MGPVTVRRDVKVVKVALADPSFVCAALGLDDGARAQPNGLMVCCPWHDDSNPSCSITIGADETLRAHCFACGHTADVLELIAKVRNLDIKKDFPGVLAAAARIAEDFGAGEVSATVPKSGTSPTVPPGTFPRVAAALFAAAPIASSPEAQRYLSGRGLLGAAIADGWGALPTSPRAKGQIIAQIIALLGADAWMASGLANEAGHLKFPKHELIIFWRDADDRVTTLQRRVLHSGAESRKYVFPSGRAPIQPYGVERLADDVATTDIAYVEGATDVLAYRALCAHSGYRRVVLGLPGVSAWRPGWAEHARGRTAHIALDADEAGDRAATRIAEDLRRAGAVRVLRQRPRGAKDWAQLLVRGSS